MATLMLAACTAPAVRYYSLAPVAAPQVPSAAAPAAYGLHLRVTQVPAPVDRIQLVVREPAANPAVQVLNESLWVAPLRDQIQTQLGAQVAARLGVPDLGRLSRPAHLPARDVSVQITRFELIWGREALLDASWTDRAPEHGSTRVCQATLSAPAGPGVAALVLAQQQLLGRLADRIAEGTRAAAPGGSTGISFQGCTQ